MVLIGLLLVVGLMFIAPILGVLFGALSGWVVGLFFEATIRDTLSAFGIKTASVAMWQIGATLGFVGGFFKSSLTTDKKD